MSLLKFQQFCEVFHEGQLRKYTNEPYIYHPIQVQQILNTYGHNDEIHCCIALGHDLLEDTEVTSDMLFNYLNKISIRVANSERIRTGIEILTNRFTKENYPKLNRIDRSNLYNNWFESMLKTIDAHLSYVVCNVKCADIIDNAESIMSHDPEFAKVWLPEKLLILSIIEHANPNRKLFRNTLNLVNKNIELCAN